MKSLIAWLGYPVIVGGGMVAGAVALARGYDMSLTITVLGLAAMIVIALLKRYARHVPRWNEYRRDVAPDFLHLVISNAALVGLTNTFVVVAIANVAIHLRVASVWPSDWPFGVQLLLAF